MTKVKVIELVGAKLDPKANYLFVINEQVVSREAVGNVINHNLDLFKNSAFLSCIGDPAKAVKVFEIPKAPRKANHDKRTI